MRILVASILALGLVALHPVAATGAADNNDDSKTAKPNAAATNSASGATAPKAAESNSIENEMQQLRGLVEQQAEEIRQLREELRAHERMLEPESAVSGSSSPAGGATQPVAASTSTPTSPDVNASVAKSDFGSKDDQGETPASINIKGISLTPGGFMAAETVWRQRALSADVNTPFNSIPFYGSPMDHETEFNASGRQSRISMLVQGQLAHVKIGGYYETDFLSAGITSNYNQSNSFTLRQRQFWGQAAFNNGFTITGGQMWSLVTETRKGMDNRTEATPLTIDAAYQIGFSWARQYGFRVTKDFGDKVWLGFAVENPETTITFHLPSGVASNFFLLGAPGSSSGLLNPTSNYAFSAWPDFVVKAAFEPGWGHYEIFGIVSGFRDRIYPCGVTPANVTEPCGFVGPIGTSAFNDSRTGGGIGANARVSLWKKVDLGVHVLAGDGIGRYGSASLPDATIRDTGIQADGTLAPGTGTLALIRSYQGLASIELHPNPKLDIYMYAGGEYAARTQYTYNPNYPTPPSVINNEGYGAFNLANYGCGVEQAPGSPVSTPTGVGGTSGFVPGSLANCAGDTRNILEGTLGFWYRFYKGSRGTIQWGPQYSYIQRSTWVGCAAATPCGMGTQNGVTVTGAQPRAVENMLFTSFRYYLP